jgi:dihydrolipoamide dehydrogenase
MSQHYELAVIGAGPGGYIAALKAAQLGAKVAIVEKHHLGGTCLNYGCIPSKALLSSAEMLHSVRQADKWGVKVDGNVGFDWNVITGHKDRVIRQLRGGIASLLKGRAITQLAGKAKFDAPGRLAVTSPEGNEQLITADKLIIATGSIPMRIPGWPDDPALVCTSDEAVHWTDLPEKLLIVGGGVIGCEFACMMQSFGVAVTIVELMPRILPTLDADLGNELLKTFKSRGIVCHLGTKVEEISISGTTIHARISNGESLAFDRVLVATGRKPNTNELGLDRAGIHADRRGFVEVNDQLETNIAGHYTIGDANGRSMLAHAASAQGVVAAENALGHAKPFEAAIPSAVYTYPEVAAVGMTEHEAREADLPFAIGRFPLGHLGKAMAARHTEGFAKTIRHRETNQLLGIHMIGHNATECIAAVTPLIQQKATVKELADIVWAHPTVGESIKESTEDALGIGLHLPPRKVIRIPASMAS